MWRPVCQSTHQWSENVVWEKRPTHMAHTCGNVCPRLGTQPTMVDSDDERPLLRM